MNLTFSEDAMPVCITFEQPLSDEALMRFSSENEWLRVERDANGELIVMSPHWFRRFRDRDGCRV